MEVNGEATIGGSQPLFADEDSQNESDQIAVDFNGSTSRRAEGSQKRPHKEKFNQVYQMLFQTTKHYVPIKHPRENCERHVLSSEQIYARFANYQARLKVVQQSMPMAEWSKPVKADRLVSVSDNICYVFREDKMKVKKTVNVNALIDSEKRNRQENGNTRSMLRNITGDYFESRYPRRAKLKARGIIEENSDDEFILSKPALSLKKVNQGGINTNKKTRGTLLIDPLPQHPRDRMKKHNQPSVAVEDYEDESEKGEETSVSDCLDSGNDERPAKKRKVEDMDNGNNSMNNSIFDKVKKIFTGISGITKGRTSKNNVNDASTSEIIDVEDSEDTEKENVSTTAKRKVKVETKHSCPMCDRLFPESEVNSHAFQCQGPTSYPTRSTKTCQSFSQGSHADETAANYDRSAFEQACKGLNNTLRGKQPCPDPTSDEDTKCTTRKNVWEASEFQETATRRNYAILSTKGKDCKDRSSEAQCYISSDDEDPTNVIKDTKKKRSVINYYGRNNAGGSTTNDLGGNNKLDNRKLTDNELQSGFMSDDDSDHDLLDGYVTNSTKKRMKQTYSRKAIGRNFDESQDENEGYLKCSRCNEFIHDVDNAFNIHTTMCLEKSSFE